jgi:hypothetical protein
MSAIAVPPLTEIDVALRKVTELLARELTNPSIEPPRWSEFEWRIARAVSAMQGVSSLMSGVLRWNHPVDWLKFIEEQKAHVLGRHLRIVELMERIHEMASQQGVALLALKGSALHAMNVYVAGERPMADVDLLVRQADVPAVTEILSRCDYEATFVSWRHVLFESKQKKEIASGFGEHFDNPIKLELHTAVRERLPVSEIDITELIYPVKAHPGVNAYPSVMTLMVHLLLHAAGNMRAQALRLIQLHDIALLAGRMVAADWEELTTLRLNGRALWWAFPPLLLIDRYYPGVIPASVIARLARRCTWVLRWRAKRIYLADVTWSNIWVRALPGIEWSPSTMEALRFVFDRLSPSREGLHEIQDFSKRHPGAASIPWYGISQSGRIWRWLTSRPPRVQTLVAVRAVLSSE